MFCLACVLPILVLFLIIICSCGFHINFESSVINRYLTSPTSCVLVPWSFRGIILSSFLLRIITSLCVLDQLMLSSSSFFHFLSSGPFAFCHLLLSWNFSERWWLYHAQVQVPWKDICLGPLLRFPQSGFRVTGTVLLCILRLPMSSPLNWCLLFCF